MTFDENVKRLVQYGIESGLVPEEERIYTTNQLLELFGEEEYTEPETEFKDVDLEEVLEELLDYAVEKGVLKENSVVYRDLFDTKIMNCLVPRPAQVIETFKELYKESPVKATDYYYKLSQDTNYIRRYRIKRIFAGKCQVSTETLIFPSTYPNRKKIRKRSQQQNWQNRAVIQNVCSAVRTKVMQDVSTIRQDRTTGSSRSQ